MKQILMDIKGEINRNTVIVRDFNTALTSMEVNAVTLEDTLDQMDVIDIFGEFQIKAAVYTYFSSVYGMFSRIDRC